MTIFKKIAIVSLVLASISVHAASVWKVTNGKNTVYFGGTVHVLKAENFPLPVEYDKAYTASDKLVFESDIEGMQTPEFQQKMMSTVVLTDGTTLQTRLTQETYAALKNYLDLKGMSIVNFNSLSPSMAALTITMLEYQANGFDRDGVDQTFSTRAKADAKPVEWFESMDEQLAFIADLGGDDDNAVINYTLDELKNLPSLIDDMLVSWEEGDLQKLNKTLVEEMATSSPQMYENLIVERNNNWMPKIMERLSDKPTEFVLVGVAHLAGKDSVLAKLEAQGYQIEKVK